MKFVLNSILLLFSIQAHSIEDCLVLKGPEEIPLIKNNFLADINEVAFQASLSTNVKKVEDFCAQSNDWAKKSKYAVDHKGKLKKGLILKGYYRGCRHDVSWMQNVRENLCEGPNLKSKTTLKSLKTEKIPGNFVFLFDGLGSFNAKLGKENGASNLDGTEGVDLRMGNGDAVNNLVGPMKEVLKDDFQLSYYGSSGLYKRENVDSASACADQIAYYTDTLKSLNAPVPNSKWIAVGYSNGGDRSIEFQREAEERGRKVDLVFTVDPVTQWASFIYGGLRKSIGNKAASTGRFVNLYEQDDKGSMPLMQIEGKPVRRADVNVLLDPSNTKELEAKKNNHQRIIHTQVVKDYLTCELKALSSEEKCDYSKLVTEKK